LSTWVVGRVRKSVRVDRRVLAEINSSAWVLFNLPECSTCNLIEYTIMKKCYYYLSIRHSEIWMICVIIV
jgi:hypothetical protein